MIPGAEIDPDVSYDYEALGRAIKAALYKAGKKQADLQRASGKSYQAVHNWVTGQNAPTLDTLLVVSELTGVPLAQLVNAGVPDNSRAPYPAWREWLKTQGRGKPKATIEAMGLVRVARNKEPTVEFYQRLAFTFEVLEHEKGEGNRGDH